MDLLDLVIVQSFLTLSQGGTFSKKKKKETFENVVINVSCILALSHLILCYGCGRHSIFFSSYIFPYETLNSKFCATEL